MSPTLLLQQTYPLQGSGKRRQAPITDDAPIELFFSVTDPLDYCGGGFFTQPLPENGIVTLSKSGQELFVRDRDTLARHRVAPGLPMVFGRVDEGAIHVPEYSSIKCHDCGPHAWLWTFHPIHLCDFFLHDLMAGVPRDHMRSGLPIWQALPPAGLLRSLQNHKEINDFIARPLRQSACLSSLVEHFASPKEVVEI